ncbi:MAG TPA: hypothetical protein VK601_14860, partial [Kofleriaceae bacterium]|nr:hypothetical protein [Kofleriaceae bacterium]
MQAVSRRLEPPHQAGAHRLPAKPLDAEIADDLAPSTRGGCAVCLADPAKLLSTPPSNASIWSSMWSASSITYHIPNSLLPS